MIWTHPQFDPVALNLGFASIKWYGLMFLCAFASFYILARFRIRHEPYASRGWTMRDAEDMLFFGIVGVIVGGRLGYVLFYKPMDYLANPLEILSVWKGGLSFHGGLLGVIAAEMIFARTRKRPLFEVADFVAPLVPLGLGFGRFANFINAELWGRPTDGSWGMVFPNVLDAAGKVVPRHPSQLYQLFWEGIVMFIVLWVFARKPRKSGAVAGLFLLLYGAGRFVIEYAREPDRFLGLLALGFSMGQWLCIPMIAMGVWLLVQSPKK
jgi:phosphatidylglycerol---prolipoprotein diacylglyceryl transferase